MRTVFCPKCGKALDQSKCKVERWFGFTWRVTCPQCSGRLEHSGSLFLLVAVITVFFGGFIPALSIVAAVLGAGLFILGVIRLVRHHRTTRQHDSPTKDS